MDKVFHMGYPKQEFTIRKCRISKWPADHRPADRHKHVSWPSEQLITQSNLGISTAYRPFIGNLDKKIPSDTADPTDPARRWNLQRESEALREAMRQEPEAQVADATAERMPARASSIDLLTDTNTSSGNLSNEPRRGS